MNPRLSRDAKPSNIGKQLDNVGSFVLSPDSGSPVIRGSIGELCLSGALVGRGYLGRQDLTDKAFPFLDEFDQRYVMTPSYRNISDYANRVYRTGDLVRLLHDDSFEFIGRADDQVKLRGQRLEIGEINQVVRSSSMQVEHVATLVLRHHTQHRDQLASFVVLSQASAISNDEVRLLEDAVINTTVSQIVQVCKEKLPGYMVPTYFLPVNRLPLSINNKIDNKALKTLFYSVNAERLGDLTRNVLRKRKDLSVTERTIQKVLTNFLQHDEDSLDVNASFYQAGLDSISMIGFAKHLQENGIHNANVSTLLNCMFNDVFNA